MVIELGNEARFFFCFSRQFNIPIPSPYHEFWNSVSARILGYPPFNEVIHWDGATEAKVVLKQPQILESYILMPVFGFSTLDIFKRRLYVRPLLYDGSILVVALIFGPW